MENWKDIENYEGLYQVSNEGRVKSLSNDKTRKEKILKPAADGGGYMYVNLYKNGQKKSHKVHRLVASAFIDNSDNLPEVNHIDEDKTNNNLENLEWCSHAFNINHGTRNERVAESQRGMAKPWVAEALSISIDMLTKDGELIRSFKSSAEAMRWLRNNGYPSASNTNIISCCKGKVYKSCYGFKWRYSNWN